MRSPWVTLMTGVPLARSSVSVSAPEMVRLCDEVVASVKTMFPMVRLPFSVMVWSAAMSTPVKLAVASTPLALVPSTQTAGSSQLPDVPSQMPPVVGKTLNVLVGEVTVAESPSVTTTQT